MIMQDQCNDLTNHEANISLKKGMYIYPQALSKSHLIFAIFVIAKMSIITPIVESSHYFRHQLSESRDCYHLSRTRLISQKE